MNLFEKKNYIGFISGIASKILISWLCVEFGYLFNLIGRKLSRSNEVDLNIR